MDGKREIPPGYRRMTKSEFVERMQRDALRRRGELPGEQTESEEEQKERAEREERERSRRNTREINAYKTSTISRYMHNMHRKDRTAKVKGFV